MHARTRRALATAAAGVVLAAGSTGAAYADEIANTLDLTVDAQAEQMSLTVGGANGSTTLVVAPANGDGKQGCNLTGSTTATFSVSTSDAAVATVSPSSVTFSSCGDVKTLTVTPRAAGSVSVSLTQTANGTGGTFNLAPATFTVNVTAPANTGPQVAVDGVTAGARYEKDAVPAATCTVTDAEDGDSTFSATLSGLLDADGLGSQTATCSYKDGGGLAASASTTYSIVDSSAPVIDYTLNPADPDGTEGWWTGTVVLTWQVSDPQSPRSLRTTGCEDRTIGADQLLTGYSCSATSSGGASGPVDVAVKRDGNGPVVGYTSVDGTVGQNGWYVSPVTATFTATDAFSGLAGSATGTTTSVTDGAAVVLDSPEFSDRAGNTTPAGAAQSPAFRVDTVAPSVGLVGGPAEGAEYVFGSVPEAPTCTASDDTSHVDGQCSVVGYDTSVGTHTVTAEATDVAGNRGTSREITYTVLAWTPTGFYSPVDMGSVWNTVKGGSTVPLKFEVFAGATELTSTGAVKSFVTKAVQCPGSTALVDPIETVLTGGTSLRYDATGGQFVQNWQTPKKPGTCAQAVITTQDGSSITAGFVLK